MLSIKTLVSLFCAVELCVIPIFNNYFYVTRAARDITYPNNGKGDYASVDNAIAIFAIIAIWPVFPIWSLCFSIFAMGSLLQEVH